MLPNFCFHRCLNVQKFIQKVLSLSHTTMSICYAECKNIILTVRKKCNLEQMSSMNRSPAREVNDLLVENHLCVWEREFIFAQWSPYQISLEWLGNVYGEYGTGRLLLDSNNIGKSVFLPFRMTGTGKLVLPNFAQSEIVNQKQAILDFSFSNGCRGILFQSYRFS